MKDSRLEMGPSRIKLPDGRTLRTFLITIAVILVYAFAVEATEINLERPLDPGRQEGVIRVMRLLANPDFFTVNEDTGQLALSEASQITLERIVETILMALLASTFGTVLAVPVSFLAARNLMENVTAPLAGIMAAVIALPVGLLAGQWVTAEILNLTANLSSQPLIEAALLLGTIGLLWFGMRIELPTTTRRGDSWLLFFRLLIIFVVLLFGLGLLAEVSLAAGNWLEDNLGLFGFLGNFMAVGADFIRLLLPAVIGFLAGLIAASFGSRYGQEAILKVSQTPARLLTSFLAAMGSAVLIYGVGSALNWLYQFDTPQNWTTIPAAAGGALMAVVGFLISPKRPFPIGKVIYTITRGILNALRSIEPLILGIVFVVWVSLGPFAGVMALTLHSIAALGKLFSEQVEGISEGPIEAIIATGANRVQMIVFAVIPQIIPPFTAFAFYRWDINVRLSTIIGFIGGGGIGFVLSQNIRQSRYRQASVMMLAIAIVVAVLDYASSKIRERII
jgi:phosphonate ABC transporter permease subunit PhnE